MTEHDLITRYEGVYSNEELSNIIKAIDRLEDEGNLYHKKENNHLEDHSTLNIVTGGWSIDLPGAGPLAKAITSKFAVCVEHYLTRFSVLGKKQFLVYDCKVKKIPSGGGFHNWHFENGSLETSSRHFAIQAYFNDNFGGGETEFLYQNRREKAKAGDVIIFPCSYTHVHRGNPPLGGTKYIAASWGWIQSVNSY